MPDKRRHRGPHPADKKLFTENVVDSLKAAVEDYSLLLSMGYAEKSALKLVGDRFSFTVRQRLAIMRCACSDERLAIRKKTQIGIDEILGKAVAVDGYNLLITVEAAMSGGVIFEGRDGCLRDLASIHGTYRKVTETIPAVELIGEFLKEKQVNDVLWFLDSPVSNSGRLKMLLSELAVKNKWGWEIRLSTNPDTELMESNRVAVSSDSVILDHCKEWFNLGRAIIEEKLENCWLVSLK